MSQRLNYLALDLGAESGRVMLGRFDGDRLELEEVYRFSTIPVRLPDGLRTDALHIWSELQRGMALAIRRTGGALAGIGVDTWGVDFALLGRNGQLLSNPYHYRDNLTEGILPKAFRRMPRAAIYNVTGVQFMPINTLYQLFALTRQKSPLLEMARTLLMIPDLFNYWLTGCVACEFTIASTTQCYDPRRERWATPMLRKFGIPSRYFPPIIMPGSVLGVVHPLVAGELGLTGAVPVVVPGCHDTALAVAAVPAQRKDFAYISSGTWSLMGAELMQPCISKASLDANFTNEGGVAGTYRFLKNLTGLWILQECRREWARANFEQSYSELLQRAAEAPPFRSFIDTAGEEFSRPGDMPAAIRRFCHDTGQPTPDTPGAVVRCVLESLALTYRETLEQLERVLERRLDPVHVVGGGSRNTLLCEFTAGATRRAVVAGPAEATAAGNVIMQAIALKHLGALEEGRSLVRRSFDVVTYEPRETERWDDAYERFRNLRPMPQRAGGQSAWNSRGAS